MKNLANDLLKSIVNTFKSFWLLVLGVLILLLIQPIFRPLWIKHKEILSRSKKIYSQFLLDTDHDTLILFTDHNYMITNTYKGEPQFGDWDLNCFLSQCDTVVLTPRDIYGTSHYRKVYFIQNDTLIYLRQEHIR